VNRLVNNHDDLENMQNSNQNIVVMNGILEFNVPLDTV